MISFSSPRTHLPLSGLNTYRPLLQIIAFKLFIRWDYVFFIHESTLYMYFSIYKSETDSIYIPRRFILQDFCFCLLILDILIDFQILGYHCCTSTYLHFKIILILSKTQQHLRSLEREEVITCLDF